MAQDPVKRPEDESAESMWSTAIWTGGALAIVAGIAVYAGIAG